MHKLDFINKKQADFAKAQDLAVIPHKLRPSNRYPAFIDLVKRRLSEKYRDEDLTSEGLRIFTTLDTRIQNTLEKTITAQLKQLEKKPKTAKLETAVVVTRREGGEIVALAGGRNSQVVGFNRALDAVRPIGSLIKPVVYLTALEQPDKYTVTTPIKDTAIRIKSQKGKSWSPKNYDGKEHGQVPLYKALTKSYNLATVRLGMAVGIARTAKTLKNLGVKRPVNLYPSLFLGASELTPLEVTQMYQTLAGDGFVTPLRAIRAVISLDNELLQRYPYTVRQTVDPAATYLTNILLQNVMTEGTGRSAYRHLPKDYNLAGKTGTTNKYRDSWFAGYSGDFLSVAWIGRDDNKSTGLSGSSGALQLWNQLMKKISKQGVFLIPPDNIEWVWVEPETGLRADPECSGVRQFPYIVGSAPTAESFCMQRQFEQFDEQPGTWVEQPKAPPRESKSWFDRILDGEF
jgi:penicillin-binding protein 1B